MTLTSALRAAMLRVHIVSLITRKCPSQSQSSDTASFQ